jgi:integrase
VKLTDGNIASLAPPAGKDERFVWDKVLPGFGVRLRRGGQQGAITRRWVAQYETKVGQTRRVTLGDPATVRCTAARLKARELLAKVRLGDDPQGDVRRARQVVTFSTLAEQYLVEVASKLRPTTQDGIRRHLRVHAKALHAKPVKAIERSDIATLLSAVERERGPIAANRARATLSTFFAWLITDHGLPANPVVGTRVRPEASRERVLSDAELAAIWHATDTGHNHDRIVRLLMLTACRRDEIGRMRWPEIVGDVFTLSAGRSKNRVAHEVALHPLVIAQLPPRSGERDVVFGRGTAGFSGWSKCKARLDARLGLSAPWGLHDLRRSCATWLSEHGTEPQHVDAVLNHVSGVARRGVAGIYNRATYAAPKRQALMKWGDHIASIARQNTVNVATLRRSS